MREGARFILGASEMDPTFFCKHCFDQLWSWIFVKKELF